MDNDFFNQSADGGFLHFWGIERVEEFCLEGSDIGEFGQGLCVAADFGFNFSLFCQCLLNLRLHNIPGDGTVCKGVGEPVDLMIK